MNSKTLDFVYKFESYLTTEAQKKRYQRIVSYCKDNPISLAEYCPLNSPVVAGQAYYVSLGDLINGLDNREFKQFDTQILKVLSIFDDNFDNLGLLYCNQIRMDIEIGYKQLNDEGDPLYPELFEVVGGTHRTTAILLRYFLSGHDLESDEVRGIQIKVRVGVYSTANVAASNGSRTMSPIEKKAAVASIQGIEPDVTSISIAAVDGRLPKQACWQYAFAVLMEEIEGDRPLSPGTAGKAGGQVYKKLSGYKIKGKKFKFPTESDEYEELILDLFDLLEDGVNHAKHDRLIQNISRDGIDAISEYMVNRYLKQALAPEGNSPKELPTTSQAVSEAKKALVEAVEELPLDSEPIEDLPHPQAKITKPKSGSKVVRMGKPSTTTTVARKRAVKR